MKKEVTYLKGMNDALAVVRSVLDEAFETREVEMTLDEKTFKIASDFTYRVMRMPFCIIRGVWDGIRWAWRDAGIQ